MLQAQQEQITPVLQLQSRAIQRQIEPIQRGVQRVKFIRTQSVNDSCVGSLNLATNFAV